MLGTASHLWVAGQYSSVQGWCCPPKWGQGQGVASTSGFSRGVALFTRTSRGPGPGPSRASQHLALGCLSQCRSGNTLCAGKRRGRQPSQLPRSGGGPLRAPWSSWPLSPSQTVPEACAAALGEGSARTSATRPGDELGGPRAPAGPLLPTASELLSAEARPSACWVLAGSQGQEIGTG